MLSESSNHPICTLYTITLLLGRVREMRVLWAPQRVSRRILLTRDL